MRIILVLLPLLYYTKISGFTYLAKWSTEAEVTCITNETNAVAPVFDLEKIHAGKTDPWFKHWEVRGMDLDVGSFNWNLSKKQWQNHPQIITNGQDNFQQIFEINTSKLRINNGWTLLSILGASASILFTPNQNWEGQSGYIVEVDYLNETTGEKELRIKKCSMVTTKSQNCKNMIAKKKELLYNGTSWTHLGVNIVNKENTTLIFIGIPKLPLELAWTDNHQRYQGNAALRFVFVRSQRHAAIFKLNIVATYLPIKGVDNEMKRNYSMEKQGNICFDIHSKNKPTSGVITIEEVIRSRIVFNSSLVANIKDILWKKTFEAGTYQISIRDVVDGDIHNMFIDDNCQGDLEIIKREKAIGCQSLVENSEQTIYDSAIQISRNKSIIMKNKDYSKICSAAFMENKNFEWVKICDKSGCGCLSLPCDNTTPLTLNADADRETIISSERCIPAAPSNVKMEETCSTWVRVAWEHPEENVTFEVTYETVDSSLKKVSNLTLKHFVIGELNANTEYRIIVRAANKFGFGSSSLPLVIVTRTDSSWILICVSFLANLTILVLGSILLLTSGDVIKISQRKKNISVQYNRDRTVAHEETYGTIYPIYYEIPE